MTRSQTQVDRRIQAVRLTLGIEPTARASGGVDRRRPGQPPRSGRVPEDRRLRWMLGVLGSRWLGPWHRALVMGCDDPSIARGLLDIGYDLEVCDPRSAMTRQWRTTIRRHGLADVARVRTMSFENLNYPEGMFDCVCADEPPRMAQGPGAARVIGQMHRVLRPGGLVLIRADAGGDDLNGSSAGLGPDEWLDLMRGQFVRVEVQRFSIAGSMRRLMPDRPDSADMTLGLADMELQNLCRPLARTARRCVVVGHKGPAVDPSSSGG